MRAQHRLIAVQSGMVREVPGRMIVMLTGCRPTRRPSQADAAAPHRTETTDETAAASFERRAAIQQRSANEARVTHRTLTAGHDEFLLTPRDILSRLSMTSAEPTKWMRRIFDKYGVPYVYACGKMRATEAQYQMLLEKITCSPSVAVGRTAFTISEDQSRSATSGSTSKNSVQERVTQMLRRT